MSQLVTEKMLRSLTLSWSASDLPVDRLGISPAGTALSWLLLWLLACWNGCQCISQNEMSCHCGSFWRFQRLERKTENTNNAKDISVKIWLPTGNLNEDSLGINFFLGCKCFYCVFSRFTEIWEETQTCEHVAWCVVSWSSFSQVRHSRNAGLKCKWRLLCTHSALHIRNRLPAFITTAIK